jgi:polysaccharide deacetylase 2 family uncharacterized protein YibQ
MRMARKRRRRGSHSAPLLLIALTLCAIVIWAIVPRHRRAREHAPPSVAQTSPVPVYTAPAAPVVTPVPSPAAAATQSPPVTPAHSPAAASGPRVALIVDDCGQWLETERSLIALPIPLTISVLPHVRYTMLIARDAAAAGKGVILHLPMEPVSHIDPGPGEITTAMSDAAIARQTEDDLAQVPLAAGVNNHEGSAATADPRVMKDVLTVVKAHGLFFIDSRTTAQSVAESQAESDGILTAARDVFLDNQASVTYSEAMLAQTVRDAQRNGSAIAIGHPKPSTLEAIRLMYPKMEAEGVTFVLARELVH